MRLSEAPPRRGGFPRRGLLAAGGGVTLGLALLWLAQGGLGALGVALVESQRQLHRALTLALTARTAAPSPQTWLALLGISFAYGVFHAAGPGHGKAVLATYLVSQGGTLRRALGLSVAAALFQGAVAIALVAVLMRGLGWVAREALGSVIWVEQASFALVALLGLWLCLRAGLALRRAPAGGAPASGEPCCGGAHHVAPAQAREWPVALATVVTIGLRPCSGAVLLLGAASLLGQFGVGVAAVLAMSLGTALTVALLALASVVARGWAERRLTRSGRRRRWRLEWLALAGGLVLVGLGLALLVASAAAPPAVPLLGAPAPGGAAPFGG